MKNFKFFALFYFGLVVLLMGICLRRPFFNWDMIGYVASAKSFEESNPSRLHAFTYSELKKSVPPEVYSDLTAGEYRQTMSQEPLAFAEQLPHYQIRLVYVGVIYVLYKMGVGIILATYLAPGIAVCIGMLFLMLSCHRALPKIFVFFMPFFAMAFGGLNLARCSTPDAFVFCAMMAAFYFLLAKRRTLLLLTLSLMIAIRTDLILLAIPFHVFLFLSERGSKWPVLFSLLATIAIYFAINEYWACPGWSTIFYVGLIRLLPYPISHPPTLTIFDYFRVLIRQSFGLFLNQAFLFYLTMFALFLYFARYRAARNPWLSLMSSPVSNWAILTAAYVAVHFLIYPSMENRFFTGCYTAGSFALMFMIMNRVSSKNSDSN